MKQYDTKIGKKDLIDFISICKSLNMDFDGAKFESIVINTLKYLNGDVSVRNKLRHLQELENKWYESLKNNAPDYSVYDDVYYLADTWVCWKKYSREYIKRIIKNIKLKNVNSIVDLGCGIGYSTALLKETFGCKVYGTNLKNTNQYLICEKISKDADFILVEDIKEIGKVDVVFASEYFEHFETPVEHLVDCINALKPNYILFANTFNAKSIGHFNTYKHLGVDYNGKCISRLFSKALNKNGYQKMITNCWNNRPNCYSLTPENLPINYTIHYGE